MAITSKRQIVCKLYNKNNVFIRVLNDIVPDLSVEKTLFGGSGSINIVFKTKIDELPVDITFNNKIKIYVRNKWSTTPRLVYYGYIVSIDPVFTAGQEQSGVTCLGATSKLSNDFLRTGNDLAYNIDPVKIDSHIKTILEHYRDSVNAVYGSYAPSMIDATVNYWSNTAYIEDTTSIGIIPYRYFNLKHLVAIQDISKFLPKNDTANQYWYWFLNDEGRIIVKKLSSTVDHTLFLKKHCTSVEMRSNIEKVVNKVFFWNESGSYNNEMVRTVYEDTTSQGKYDLIADKISDSKVTTYLQARLLAEGKLQELKENLAEATITISEAKYDILTFQPGQVIKLLDVKDSTLFPSRMIINSLVLKNDQIVLTLSTPRPDLTTQVETDREYIDSQLKWFGNILVKLDGSRISTGVQHWTMEGISFTPVSNTKIDWTTGTFILPNGVKRVIAAGTTGEMDPTLDYYIYIDEKNVWGGKDTGLPAEVSGTGIVRGGETFLVDSSKTWKTDQWKGYALWINPTGVPEKHIIAKNTATVLYIEADKIIMKDDSSCPYEIHKLVPRITTTLSASDTADSGSTTTLIDAARTEVNDFWNGYELKILSGSNSGLVRAITDFVAVEDKLVFAALPYAIVAGVEYSLYLSSESQIVIMTGLPTSNTTDKAGVSADIIALTPDYEITGATRAYQALDYRNFLITDLINASLNTSAKTILSDFDFGAVNYAGAVKAGTIAWDASGVITGGSGVAVYRKGIVGAAVGVVTFSIDATSGSAYFKGEVAAGSVISTTIQTHQIVIGTSVISTALTAAKATDPLADQTSANMSYDTARVNTVAAATVQGGAARANSGLDANAIITKAFLNTNLTSISLPADGVRIDANGIYGRTASVTTFYISSTGSAYFKGELAVGIAITSPVITGGTIQTAASGQRIVLEGAGGPSGFPHEILVYPSTGTEMQIFGGASYFYFTANLAVRPIRFDNPSGLVALQINETSIYVPGNITVDGNVDGVDISTFKSTYDTHAANASAHHTRYTDVEARTAVTLAGIPGTLYPSASYNLGTTSYYWNNLYLNYLRFHSSYGQIYFGANLFVDLYNLPSGRPTGWTLERETRFSTTLTPHTNCYEHIGWRSGLDGATTDRIWRVINVGWISTGGCSEGGVLTSTPIRIENSALKVIKKVREPKFFSEKDCLECSGLKGSKPGKYFTEDEFPDEMKMLYPGKDDKKPQIELFRSMGILVQAIKELDLKVENLETKIKSYVKKN